MSEEASRVWTVPNVISLVRLAGVPLFLWLVLGPEEDAWALVVLMAPETLTTVRRGSTAADVEALCASTGYSRFPVEGDDGELLGYLHIKDVLETDESRRERVIEDKWTRPFATVSADNFLHDALETLQRKGAHMARVVGPDGATLGLATLEDVIEELVGEIRDAAHLEDGVQHGGNGVGH